LVSSDLHVSIGVITKEELGAIMNSLGMNATTAEIEDMINDIDLDQSGTLDLDGKYELIWKICLHPTRVNWKLEFIKMMTMVAKPANFEEEMRSAFKVFDKDNSGTISKDEMAQVMKMFGEALSSEELDLMLQEVDKNGDGTIDCRILVYLGFASLLTFRI